MTKKSFKDFYEDELRKPTPASLFVKRIAEATKRQENTVRMWLSGRQKPDTLTQEVIAETLGADAGSLFPDD
jgi:hypothetical protein